jgi:hypothetical protein
MKRGVFAMSRMRSGKAAVLTLAVLALAIPGSLIGLAHSFDAQSTVTIKYGHVRHAFVGRVSSPRVLCVAGRTVKVFKVIPGPNRLIGIDATNARGRYAVPRQHPRGFFYARVIRSDTESYGHSHLCRGDRSPTIHVRR